MKLGKLLSVSFPQILYVRHPRIAQQSPERCNTQLTLRYVLSFPSIHSSTGQCTSHAVLPYRSVLRLASAAPTAGEMTETKFQIYLKEREKREMQRTRQSRRARLDETNNARHFCTVLFFLFSHDELDERPLREIPKKK